MENSGIFEFSEEKRKISKNSNFRTLLDLNYFMVKKFHLRRLDSNNKKTISAILEFLILRGKIAKFGKIRIFELNVAIIYSMVKKFHMRGLDLNNKKKFRRFLNFRF